MAAPNDTKAHEFSCTACAETFATTVDQRAHFKSERHVYNTKRKQAGLKPISQEAWERKLRESRGGYEQKGTAHLKAKKPSRKESGDDSQLASEAPEAPSEGTPAAEPEPEAPLTPRSCLFDRKRFDSVELCLAYMEKTHSFFIPDQEYCSDVPALLSYLGQKIQESNKCIHCNRGFPDMASVRRHMLDKNHTRLASEARTRRGNYNEAATNDLEAELEPYYDYRSSVLEVADKINKPEQKVASILRFFDEDKDKMLGPGEVAALWMATSEAGAALSEAQYIGACAMAKADPKDGLNVEALGKLYAGGFADLDAHFRILQDLLVKKHAPKPLESVQEGDEGDEDDEDDDEESESEDGEEDQIVEVDDEDEFEEVMRVLGLQKVTITATGDLMLPNGNIAAHRDMSYIYKQRGVRNQEVALTGGVSRLQKRAQLMLSNSGSGCLKMAITQRQEAREGKRIIAFLREKNKQEQRLGVQMNTAARRAAKIRTGRGDCSNGR